MGKEDPDKGRPCSVLSPLDSLCRGGLALAVWQKIADKKHIRRVVAAVTCSHDALAGLGVARTFGPDEQGPRQPVSLTAGNFVKAKEHDP